MDPYTSVYQAALLFFYSLEGVGVANEKVVNEAIYDTIGRLPQRALLEEVTEAIIVTLIALFLSPNLGLLLINTDAGQELLRGFQVDLYPYVADILDV